MKKINLEGKKTYITSIATICYAIGGAIIGELDVNIAIPLALVSLQALFVRVGIGK